MNFTADCKDTGSIHFRNAALAEKLVAGKSHYQGKPEGMTLKVKGMVVRKDKEGGILSKEEKEMTFQSVWTCAGGKKGRDLITFFPAMAGAGEWEMGAKYEIEVAFAE